MTMPLNMNIRQDVDHDHHAILYFTTAKDPFGWLDNTYDTSILFEGLTFRSAEALFQWLRFEGHPEIQSRILSAKRASRTRSIAKNNGDLLGRGRNWDMSREDVERMDLSLRLKFQQHPELQSNLLETGDRRLIKNTVRQKGGAKRFWGAEFSEETHKWTGANIKGQLLMSLRDEFRGA